MGALLTLAVPGIAFANTMSVTVQTPGATSGPTTADSEIKTDADCDSGTLISGAGINQAIGTGMSSNGNHAKGGRPPTSGTVTRTVATFPTCNNSAHDFGKKAAADGETNPNS